MGKKDSKHDRGKSHKKKHKKEKKYKKKKKKSKHHRRRESSESGDSSASSSSSSASSSGNESKREKAAEEAKTARGNFDDSGWEYLFSDRNATAREKTAKKREQPILDRPGQSVRELNPYWKDGGNGLPPAVKSVSLGAFDHDKDCDASALKEFLAEAKEVAFKTKVPLEKIVEEKWGSLDKLTRLIRELEERKCRTEKRRLDFKKPGEIQGSDYVNTYKRNWKKKPESSAVRPKEEGGGGGDEEKKEPSAERKKALTSDEMNALAAKAMKAELMGNKALAEELKRELEEAKKARESAAAVASGSGAERKDREVVLLTKTNAKGLTKPVDAAWETASDRPRKRQKMETHRGNERLRYFMDDDKHSLQSMFEREKFATSDESNEMFARMMRRKKRGNVSDDDEEEEFLDRARSSEFESKELERERARNVNEARSRHKTVENCRWCLDGANVEKHLIVSVGANAYLRLPSTESLTEHHCLIVPVHHVTCGTLADEDVWSEVQEFRRALCRMFGDRGQDVVFFENARSFRRFPHMVLHCVPMDREIGDLAPIYFKKAIMESETEWSTNKKLIDLAGKDVRRCVPKGLPYFAVDFGADPGFAHVIEDERLFPGNFAEEIIAGMMDLEHSKWRKRRRESFEVQAEKVAKFAKMWKKYDEVSNAGGKRDRCDDGDDDSGSDR